MDADSLPLQRLQIIKGWIDEEGTAHRRVVEVAGDRNNGADVDLATCRPRGEGFDSLCAVWEDSQFHPERHAWYYARAIENPSCRWSQTMCTTSGIDCDRPDSITDGFEACCSESHRPIIQERAISSPVWYAPAGG